jgi:signal transduction histidine kinase
MAEEIDRMTKLVGDLRELTLLEAGQLKLDKAAINVNAVIRNAVDGIKSLAAGQGITVAVELEDLPLLHADAVRMTQVLDNLLLNAVKYTPSGGRASSDQVLSAVQLPLTLLITEQALLLRTCRISSSIFTGLILRGPRQAATAASGWPSCGRSLRPTAAE